MSLTSPWEQVDDGLTCRMPVRSGLITPPGGVNRYRPPVPTGATTAKEQ